MIKFFMKIILVLSIIMSFNLCAAIPPRFLNYQGKLTDTSGVAINGLVNITFRIYDKDTGGTALWSEFHPGVVVTKGLFDVLLGTISPLNISFDTLYYMELEVDGETLSPRILLAATPYSFRAIYAETTNVAFYSDTALYTVGIPETLRGDKGGYLGILTIIDTVDTNGGAGLVVGSTGGPGIYVHDNKGSGIVVDRSGVNGLEVRAGTSTARGLYIHPDTSATTCAPDTGIVVRGACYGALIGGDVHITGNLVVDGAITPWPGAAGNYIWNQDTAAQSANMWITGTARVGTLSAEHIEGQGFMKVDFTGSAITISDTSFLNLFSATYTASGTGSAVMITFTGNFDDRASVKGAAIEVQLVRDPGTSSELVLTSQRMAMVNLLTYSDRVVTLSALDTPPAGNHTYAVRARAFRMPLYAGRFVKGNLQVIEVKK